MTEESVITEELEGMVGVEAEPEVFKVEAGHIRRFAEAVGDPNPLWSDVEYGTRSRYGSIIGPPLFLIDAGMIKMGDRLMQVKCPLPGFLNAGTEVEFYQPMKVGDEITTVAKVTDLQEKTGKSI